MSAPVTSAARAKRPRRCRSAWMNATGMATTLVCGSSASSASATPLSLASARDGPCDDAREPERHTAHLSRDQQDPERLRHDHGTWRRRRNAMRRRTRATPRIPIECGADGEAIHTVAAASNRHRAEWKERDGRPQRIAVSPGTWRGRHASTRIRVQPAGGGLPGRLVVGIDTDHGECARGRGRRSRWSGTRAPRAPRARRRGSPAGRSRRAPPAVYPCSSLRDRA